MLGIGRARKLLAITPPTWPARRGRARILVENPDGAELWAHTEALQEAGYDVASCSGPSTDGHAVCPLVANGRCGAVEDADVVISTTTLGAVVAAISSRHPQGLIVEGGDADLPMNQARLFDAVETALLDIRDGQSR